MKRRLVLFIFIFTTNTVSGQMVTGKGATWVGGTAGFSSVSSEGVTATSIALSPNFNHFINNNIFLGAAVDWRRVSENGTGSSTIGIGPHLGLSFAAEDSNSIPYVAGGFRYLSNRSDQDGFAVLSRRGSDLFVAGGFNVVVRESLGVLIEASYHIQSFEGGVSFNAFVLGIGVTGILN